MKKRILVTSTDVMMLQFLIPHIYYLKEKGYEVEVACSNVEGHIDELRSIFGEQIPFQQVELCRSPISLSNFKGFTQLRKIIKNGHFDIGLVSVKRIKILYVAHGFHFYRSAPIKNWLFFYPIEKILSLFTDEIITINNEDYKRARAHFRHPIIVKFPGIGLDTQKFFMPVSQSTINSKREELGIKAHERIILSVGELESRKNHLTSISAFSKANLKDAILLICGVGTQREVLQNKISELNLTDTVRLLGYRYDINELCHAADVFLFTTFQEGLSVALMEAMAAGLPCVVSEIRGNTDLIEPGKGFYCDPHREETIVAALQQCFQQTSDENIAFNREKIRSFDISIVRDMLLTEIIKL